MTTRLMLWRNPGLSSSTVGIRDIPRSLFLHRKPRKATVLSENLARCDPLAPIFFLK